MKTIFDTEANLEWSVEDYKPMTWSKAMDLVEFKRDNWRIPTLSELFSLVNHDKHNPACDDKYAINSSDYWSSTAYSGSGHYVWVVHFQDGGASRNYKTYSYRVRLVRDLVIKPCPFCGGTAELHIGTEQANGDKGSYVECVGCGASSCHGEYPNADYPEIAVEAWNERVNNEL